MLLKEKVAKIQIFLWHTNFKPFSSIPHASTILHHLFDWLETSAVLRWALLGLTAIKHIFFRFLPIFSQSFLSL